MKKALFAFAVILLCTVTYGQEKEKNFFQRFGEWRYNNLCSKCDTNYLAIPEKSWLARVGDINEFNTYKIASLTPGEENRKITQSGYSNRMRIGIFYRGLGLAYAVGLNKKFDRNLSLGINGNRFGGNFNWQQNTHYLDGNPVHFNMFDLNTYYFFNYRKFSMNAATRHTFIQKKSAGSFFLTADFNRLVMKDLILNGAPINPIHQFRIALGGGYAYNWAFDEGKFVINAAYAPNINLLNITREFSADNKTAVRTLSDTYRVSYGHNISLGGFYDINHRVVIGFLGSNRYAMSNSNTKFSISTNYMGVEGFVKVRF